MLTKETRIETPFGNRRGWNLGSRQARNVAKAGAAKGKLQGGIEALG